LALLITRCPAFAKAGSMSFAAFASSAENISRGPPFGVLACTRRPRSSSGICDDRRHVVASP
jgi:hypothetical protein